jgi:hypothetical protein
MDRYIVIRSFSFGGRLVPVGETLSAAELGDHAAALCREGSIAPATTIAPTE